MNQNYLKELESILEEKLSKKYNTKIKVIVRKNEDEITIIYGNDEIKNENFFKNVFDITNRFLEVAEQNIVNNCYDLSEIANIFNVSIDSVKMRGEVLGVWE